MSAFDIAVLSILAVSAAFAFWRGFVTEALSLASWGGAVFISLLSYPWASGIAQDYVTPSWMANIIALILLFIFSFFFLRWLADFIGERVRESTLGPIDRALGAIFGMLRGVVILGLIYLLFDLIVRPTEEPEWLANSKTGPMVEYSAYLMRSFAERNGNMSDLADRAKEKLAPNLPSLPKGDKNGAQEEKGYKDSERKLLDGLMDRITDAQRNKDDEKDAEK